MRLPNGFGSVYKLSGKRRNPYIARITVRRDENGKQIYQTIGYFGDKKVALDALTKFRISPVSDKANITLKELYDEWNPTKYEYISKQTSDCYKAAWNNFSKYEKAKFKELRTAHFQSIIDSCHKSGKSRSSLKNIRIVANMLYDYAMQNDIVNKNYAEFIIIPKEEKEEKERFSDLEIKTLEKYADTVEWIDTVLIMIYSGMRISEMLELTKFNVDLEKQIITGGVKTEAGKNRIIPIHPKIYKYIVKWYNKNGDTLICNEKGKYLSPNAYRNDRYIPSLKKIEVRTLTPHACRHTFASLMAKAGADTLAIQKIIGHSDYSTTANIYTHTDIEELKKAINLI
jgi:integrase